MTETFTSWYNKNKELLRDEYRTIKASINFDGVVDIQNLKQWAKQRYDSI